MDVLEDTEVGDLADLDVLLSAISDMEAVVHLGSNPGDCPREEISQDSYVCTYNMFEAAGQCDVKCVSFASRASVLCNYSRNLTCDIFVSPRPQILFEDGKIFGENLGFMYASRYDMEVVSVRIGNFNWE